MRSKRTASFSVQLAAWIAPPSIWFATPSGLIASPTSTATTSRRTRMSASPSISATTAQYAPLLLVAGKADAVPGALARPPCAPAGARGRRLEDGPRPRVPQMAQAQRQRILAALGRELVEEGLDRKYVGEGAERAQRRGPQRHREETVARDLEGGKVVERDGVAVGAAAGRERRVRRDEAREGFFELARGKERRAIVAAGPRDMAVAPDRVAPADDLAGAVEIGLDLDRHRGAEGRAGKLVGARPLHAHRPALRRAGEEHGVERDVVGAVVAVAAGALDMLDDDPLRRQRQHEREIGAQIVHALRMRPDMHLVAAPLRDGAGRRDRRMGDERPRVGAPQGPGGRCGGEGSRGRRRPWSRPAGS